MTWHEGRDVTESRRSPDTRVPGAAVLLAQLALVAVIYWPTLQVSFLADAWVLLARVRTSALETLATPIGYNYQPVAYAWIALIRACFGESARAFQAVNLVQLALLGYLTYELGCRLLRSQGAAFLAGLLVVGNAALYEVTSWPLAGNTHLLAAQLCVLSVILAWDVGIGRFPRSGPWLLALVALAAIFAHPAMAPSLPICAVTVWLASRSTGE